MTLRQFLGFFLVASALAGCTGSQKSTSGTASKAILPEEQQIQVKFLFYNAAKERSLGNIDKALDYYSQCIHIDGRNHAAMYEVARIYQEKKKFNDALFFSTSASQLDPANEWYKHLSADLYTATHKMAEAEVLYGQLYHDHPENLDYALDYAMALLGVNKIQEAIKVYDEVERQAGASPELTLEKQRLWLKLGKTDKAASEIEKLIATDKQNIHYYSMLIDLYQANGMFDKVNETIQRMKQVDADNPYVYLALAGYYRNTKDYKQSFENLKLAFGSNELEHDVKMQIITSYMPLLQGNPEMLQQGLELTEILAKTHPDDALSQAIYGDFLAMSEKFSEAKKQYKTSLAIDANNMGVWQQMLICDSELRDFDDMLSSADSALSFFPEQSVLYLFKGVALTFKKSYSEAVKTLTAGSKLVVDNDTQLKDFYERLGDNYNSLKEYEKSDSYYDKCLLIDPNDASVLNNYSYYLSLRKEKLEKAEQMAKKCNELNPAQSNYEDTYGWVLYVMGKYDDARTWIQKALDHGGSGNGTILEHMGDILYKLGDKSKAAEFWNNALKSGDHSDLLEKKIKDNNLYE